MTQARLKACFFIAAGPRHLNSSPLLPFAWKIHLNADSRRNRRSGLGPASGRESKGSRGHSAAVSARSIALEALLSFERRATFVNATLDQLFFKYQPAGADRRLATELACGAVRRRLTLDAILAAYCSRPLHELDLTVRQILRLGVLQLLFMDRIPPHAAVDEAVQACRQFGKSGLSGFVNGVLRTIQRETEPGAVRIDSLVDAAANLLIRPYEALDPPYEGVQLGRPFAPEPRLDRAGYLSTVLSLPRWFVERQLQRLPAEGVLRQGLWFQSPGEMGLRVNLLRATREQVAQLLEKRGIATSPGTLPAALRPHATFSVEEIPEFAAGWFSVQDETAMQAVALLNPQPGQKILDLCAAPGGKTTHLAEWMGDSGQIVACDIAPERLQLVNQAAQRLQLKSITTRVIDSRGTNLPAGPFDAVLLDVPCSNSGVLGKRPEARWRLSPEGLRQLVETQQRLLEQALQLVCPGGRVLYSTCSIEPEENELLVQQVLQQNPHVELLQEQLSWPGLPTDGGYRALLMCKGD